MRRSTAAVRIAGAGDAATVARLLHDFNTEFSDPTPDVPVLAERIARFILNGDMTVVLGGPGPDGVAVLRFRPCFWTDALDAYLQELYVAPPMRGRGLGGALLDYAMEVARDAGATHIDLNTSEDDRAAIGLYESRGFTNREHAPDGPTMFYYERDL